MYVFPPELDAVTIFIKKVFRDIISQFVTLIVQTAQGLSNPLVFLHTFATSVYFTSIFADYIVNSRSIKTAEKELIKSLLKDLFAPYVNYVDLEVNYMQKEFKTHLDKWQLEVKLH